MVDCLIVGHNDGDFPSYVKMLEGMGTDSGGYRDLALSFVQWEGQPTRALDVFNRLGVPDANGDRRRYHNFEMIWPTILYFAAGNALAFRSSASKKN